MLGEGIKPSTGQTGSLIYCPKCSGHAWTAAAGDSKASDRHNGGSNICFLDGHVEWWKYEDLLANKNDVWGHDSR